MCPLYRCPLLETIEEEIKMATLFLRRERKKKRKKSDRCNIIKNKN